MTDFIGWSQVPGRNMGMLANRRTPRRVRLNLPAAGLPPFHAWRA